jgi:seryl-tRNA synthetase
MMSLELIRSAPDRLRQAARVKGVDVDIDAILDLDARTRAVRQALEDLRAQRNRLSDGFRGLSEAERQQQRQRASELGAGIQDRERELVRLEGELRGLLLLTPNIPWSGAPIGPDESANIVVRQVGRPPSFDFTPLDHVELMARHDWADLSAVSRICGARTYALKGRLALLEQAILFHASQTLQKKGFSLISVPAIARPEAFVNTGHFPLGRDDAFELPREGLFLAGTSEIVVNSLHSGQVLDHTQLPILYCAFSPCFRREAGSGGRDVRGLLRVHQFYKVEQYVICRDDPAESALWHDRLLENAESIVQSFELPYQVVECSTGDMGVGKVRMNDIETWVPSLGRYRETHSCSTLHGWQARRANIRYRDADGRIRFVHTLNNTAIATPRILVPLLENHQDANGMVRLPAALSRYMDGERL